MQTDIVFSIFVIFTGTAILATAALFTRQSLLVAYILLGILLGPWGLQFINDTQFIDNLSEVGIIFLLFLLGLHLHPQGLWHMLRKATVITLVGSLILEALGFGVAWLFGFTVMECWVIGSAIVFSSTIIGLKLLPTNAEKHKHIGEIMISILLLQDLIAILVMLVLHALSQGNGLEWTHFLIVLSLPTILVFAFLFEHFVIEKLWRRFESVHEYGFLLAIGWCMGMAELSSLVGLSEGIGAFIAGIALAASPIAIYIANHLKPLRDFFLVMFFFAAGANFNFRFISVMLVPTLFFVLLTLCVKPWLFSVLLRWTGEKKSIGDEVGIRLGQASEFSLLVAFLAAKSSPALIGENANYLIQSMTLITFIVSSYWVVMRYQTPLASSTRLRRE